MPSYPDLMYKKTGVIVSDISLEEFIQGNLFEKENNRKNMTISRKMDELNNRYGKDSVKLAVQGKSKEWKLRQEKLSPGDTTRWDELPIVKA